MLQPTVTIMFRAAPILVAEVRVKGSHKMKPEEKMVSRRAFLTTAGGPALRVGIALLPGTAHAADALQGPRLSRVAAVPVTGLALHPDPSTFGPHAPRKTGAVRNLPDVRKQ